MIGIYRYTNIINGKTYIGQSVDIEHRKYQHVYASSNRSSNEYNTKFHRAIRKFGLDSFLFDVLIEVPPESYSPELLNELEIHFIKKYNSFCDGYNSTPGGERLGNTVHSGESNGRSLLTEEDVKYIRECYNNHIPFREVAKEFVGTKITTRGLQKVWSFENWKNIHPEYYNEENRYWHSHQAKANNSEVARNNIRAFTSEQVRAFREDYKNGLGFKEIKQKYDIKQRTSTLRNAILRITYKDIE